MQRLFHLAAYAAVALLAAICAGEAAAQTKPAWATKGTDALNRSRSNDSYELRSLESFNPDKTQLMAERFNPLLTHIRTTYGADIMSMTVDSVPGTATYTVAYTGTDGARHTVQAQLIDEHCAFDDYESNDYGWELYQLFAIGRPDSVPQYDEFEVTHSYNGLATAMSLIPGWGQIYKGQTAKGCVIIGLEAASIATIIAAEHKRSRMMDDAAAHPEVYDSWKGKANSWRNVRNVAIGVAAATYIYNLIDAATSKGARRVMLHKSDGSGLTFAPMIDTDGAGMSLAFRF